VIAAVVTICAVLVLFGVLAAITAVYERLPAYPPDYDDADVLPPPTVRAQRYQPHPDSEWIVDGPHG